MVITAPSTYAKSPGDADLVYRSICQVLSDRGDEVAWSAFGDDEWRLIEGMAVHEGVAPLLYWKLKDDPARLPVSTFRHFKEQYYNTVAHNTLLYKELARILNALAEAGIPVIVLKGAALAATLYEDIGLRPMGDLDLLVKTNCLEKTLKELQVLGYLPEKLTSYHIVLLGSTEPITLELHWHLVRRNTEFRSVHLDWFWEQVESYDAYGNSSKSGLMLSPISCLLYLVLHLYAQHWDNKTRLLWLHDIHMLHISWSKRLDWSLLFSNSSYPNFIGGAMEEVENHFKTPLPETLRSSGTHLRKSRMVLHRGEEREPPKVLFRNVFKAFNAFSWRIKLRLIRKLIFPPQHTIQRLYQPKPSWLWPLFYFLRWLNFLSEGLRVLMSLGIKATCNDG